MNAQEKFKEFNKEMDKRDKEKENSVDNAVDNSTEETVTMKASELAELKKMVTDTNEANKSLQKQVTKLNSTVKNSKDIVNQGQETRAMDDVLQGYPSTFEKDYSIPRENGDNLEFRVKMRAMNVQDQTQISNAVLEYSDGTAASLPDRQYSLLEGIAAIDILAPKNSNNPGFLTDPNQVYDASLVVTVYEDYLGWFSSFRSQWRG